MNSIGASICCFYNPITYVINHIGIIACATYHRVGTSAAIKGVASSISGEGVINTVTRTINSRRTSKYKVF